jgi:hypothetical protein
MNRSRLAHPSFGAINEFNPTFGPVIRALCSWLWRMDHANPYQPPATLGSDQRIRGRGMGTWLILLCEIIKYCAFGSVFVLSMHVASRGVETIILQVAALGLLVVSVTTPRRRVGAVLPVYALFPFCWYVSVRFCGDRGPQHFLDSVPYLFALIISFVVVTSSSIWKLGRVIFWPRKRNGD